MSPPDQQAITRALLFDVAETVGCKIPVCFGRGTKSGRLVGDIGIAMQAVVDFSLEAAHRGIDCVIGMSVDGIEQSSDLSSHVSKIELAKLVFARIGNRFAC